MQQKAPCIRSEIQLCSQHERATRWREPRLVQQEAREPADEDGAQGAADEDAEDGGHQRVLGPAAVLRILGGALGYQAVHLVHGQRGQRGLHRRLQAVPGQPPSACLAKQVCRCSQFLFEWLPEGKEQVVQVCQARTQPGVGFAKILHALRLVALK